MRKRVLAGIAAAVALAAPAAAESWKQLDFSGNSLWLIDGDSVKSAGGISSFTYFEAFRGPVGGRAYHGKFAMEIRCASKDFRFRRITEYDLAGKQLAVHDIPDAGNGWTPIQQGSTAGSLRRYLCDGAFGTAARDPWANARAWRDKMKG